MRRLLLVSLLLLCPAAVQAQHLVRGVNLGNTITLTDSVFGAATLTYNAATDSWTGASAGQGLTYTLEVIDTDIGEDWVVSLATPTVGYPAAFVEVISKPGVKPLVFRKQIPYWPTALFLFGFPVPVPFPPSTVSLQ